jgi:hypothetical protein
MISRIKKMQSMFSIFFQSYKQEMPKMTMNINRESRNIWKKMILKMRMTVTLKIKIANLPNIIRL